MCTHKSGISTISELADYAEFVERTRYPTVATQRNSVLKIVDTWLCHRANIGEWANSLTCTTLGDGRLDAWGRTS